MGFSSTLPVMTPFTDYFFDLIPEKLLKTLFYESEETPSYYLPYSSQLYLSPYSLFVVVFSISFKTARY